MILVAHQVVHCRGDSLAGMSAGCVPQHSGGGGIFLTVFQPLLPEQIQNGFHLSDSHNYTINNSLLVIQCIEEQLILHGSKAYLISRIMYEVNYCKYKH